MPRLDFVPRPYREPSKGRTLRAVAASFLFHGFLFASVISLGLLYRAQIAPIKNGSAPGAPTITLATMVIVSAPPPVTPPAPLPPTPIAPATPPLQALLPPKFPDEGVPVLAAQAPKHASTPPAKILVAAHVAASRPLSAPASSYSPGPNLLPHPPYPTEARDRGQTGVVVMNVQFNAQGDVARAEVQQSSGVPVLDVETKSFIRAHWHSSAYAGQTIRQPVEYSLQDL